MLIMQPTMMLNEKNAKNHVVEQKDLFWTCKVLEIIKSHSKDEIYRSTSAEGDLCLTETMLEGR